MLFKLFRFKKRSKQLLYTAYSVLHEDRLVLDVLSGTMRLDSMIEYETYQSSCEDYKADYDTITVLDDLVIDVLLSDIVAYVAFVKKNENVIAAGNRRVCIVINTPNQEVYIKQYKQLQTLLPQSVHFFKTINESVAFLAKSSKLKTIARVLKDLAIHPTHHWG